MLVSINNAVFNNWVFISIFLILILVSCKRKREQGFSLSITKELKGFAILAIVFSHIGYFLITDHQFLFPLSVLAGVGVNLFLFLSGYGLTISSLSKKEGKFQFYKKRLIRLLIPFWIVLISFLLMDYFLLGISYDKDFIIKAFLGIFTNAELFESLNSSFWYITLILFYYILFPLVFIKRYPWISALLLYFLSYYFLIKLDLVWLEEVAKLYKLHIFAFPLGVGIAWIFTEPKILNNFIILKTKQIYKKIEKFAYPIISIFLIIFISYFAINSGVGETIKLEQNISIVTMFAIILLFLIKKFEFRLLGLFGIYSYELYLFHWPIMYRYEIFYKYFPAWIATILYLVLFICLGWVLQLVSKNIKKHKF
jgi:peptidoglycan/LPS O-acetylase OafA/YrhL